MEEQTKILNFIQGQELMVLSTISPEGAPEAATIESAVTDNFEVIFQTFEHYRKYKNLQHQQKIAAVFGWRNEVTVQYEGIAELLQGELLDYYQGFYSRKVPTAKRFSEMKGACLFRILPQWARYTDISVEPSEVFEVNLASTYVRPENMVDEDNKP